MEKDLTQKCEYFEDEEEEEKGESGWRRRKSHVY
jgi:hypothetical protein